MIATEIFAKSVRHFLRPLAELLDDPSVTEIMVVGPDRVYVERSGRVQPTDAKFDGEFALRAAVENVAEYVDRPIDDRHPTLDGRLPDGSRVHVILPPASRCGICLTIRRFQRATFDLDHLVRIGAISPAAREFLEIAVLLRKNIVVSGGTGTGKTSFLNALSGAIPPDERIVVIEDSSELQLHQPHTVYLESRPAQPDGGGALSIRDLFVNSLRMRPDRVIVGEVRRGEALDLVQAMLSGHAGSLTTVHASSPATAAVRLETLCTMSDVSMPVHVARQQVASAIDLVVQLERFHDGSRRVRCIAELVGVDDAHGYQTPALFQFRRSAVGREIVGELTATGNRPTFAQEVFDLGYGGMIDLTRPLFESESQSP